MVLDSLFINGRVYTMDGRITSAVGVCGDRIAFVGTDAEARPLCSRTTQVVDLHGNCMLPGFNDSHMHFLLTGFLRNKIDLSGSHSIAEMIRRGQKFVVEHQPKPGTWIVGYGFDHNLFEEHRLPVKEDVDQISTNHPVLLDRVCGHIGIVNSMAIKLLGFTKDSVMEGGVIQKDSDGNPNGIVEEGVLDWIKTKIPKPGIPEVRDIIEKTSADALRLGITSVQTDDLEATDFDTVFQSYMAMRGEGRLHTRIFEEVQAARPDLLKAFIARNMRTGWGDDYFRIGNIKLLTDGSLGARNAGMLDDYSDKAGERGTLRYTQDELDEMIGTANQAGLQVACHSIGDAAISQVVTAIEHTDCGCHNALRNRVVHCQIGNMDIYRRIAKANICVDIQPPFLASDHALADQRIGPERAKTSYAWKALQDLGVHIGGGSDSPVETYDPMWGIYCAVTRKDRDGLPADGWHPSEKLTVEEAVRLYTVGSAYQSFDENKKGTITVGKLADLVVLSEDPFRTDPENLYKIQAIQTVLGGQLLYTR